MQASLRFTGLGLLFLLASCGGAGVPEREKQQDTEPRAVKVVVVTLFEIGEDTGDRAGEFQLWKERRTFDEVLPFHGYKDLHYNSEDGLLVMVTGIGTARSAAATMAVGMDPRFDLSKAYWLTAGIAGIDPEDATVGSAAWAEYLVDGDLGHHIDAREIPEDWPFGYFPRYTTRPFDPKKPEPSGEMFRLNPGLTEWAYQLTKDIELPDDPSVQHERDLYTEHPNAQGRPKVIKGDHIAALTFWHGALLNDWANRLVEYWTDGKGNMVTSGMEDTGSYLSVSWLDKIERADKDRFMVLRMGSNFTMQPPTRSAAENLLKETQGYKYAGLEIAVESGYLVASRVVDELLENWDQYEDIIPTSE
ncbi:MAG: purine nucleoside permease [Gammaproteobacteria bacterium]|jgi:purine nucleoside permease|nr:purine nucleoside permease [Gammaproteobacteria bacterium]